MSNTNEITRTIAGCNWTLAVGETLRSMKRRDRSVWTVVRHLGTKRTERLDAMSGKVLTRVSQRVVVAVSAS